MFRLARALARAARAASHRLGRTGGTTAPGRMLLKLSPGALGRMAGELDDGSLLVSATNGKTTTSAMLAGALEEAGTPVVHNRAGSNMAWGVATALLDAGRRPGQLGLFEVDEAWLPSVARELRPRLLLLSNLFRDQLDRYGELELLADRWAELVAELDGRASFVLNADDPLVADLGRGRERVTYFGVEDDSQALLGMQHAADSKHCRNCGSAYEYEAIYLGHLGRYRCPNCGRERPRPAVAATRVELDGMSGSLVDLRTPEGELSVRLPVPGLYNVYNAVAAAATALELGVPLATIGERAHELLRLLRPRRDDPDRRATGLDPPHQESGRGERGAANAPARGGAARPLDRAQRQHRRRPGHLVGLGCRLRGARRPRAAGHLLRHARRGDGAAAEVRRHRRRAGGRSRPRFLARRRARDARPGERLFALPTYTALLELRDLLARRGLARRWSE